MRYREAGNSSDQVKLLATGAADVSIGDRYIFLYNLKQWRGSGFTSDDFEFHHILPITVTYMAFNNQQMCEDFNTAAKKIRLNGTYDAIYKRYLMELQ